MSARRRYTVASGTAFAARLVDRAGWYSGGIVERSRLGVRQALAHAGIPIAAEFLELGCAAGNEASGLFSEFTAVLGCLRHYEQHREIYCGLRVDFGSDGLYYDTDRGQNWWQYYFEPLALGSPSGGRRRVVPLWQHDLFAEGAERLLSRDEAHALVRRYIRPRQLVLDEVERFVAAHFDVHVIGIHYRGTDKHEESPPVDLPRMIEAVRGVAERARHPWKLFVATDDESALHELTSAFPDRVVSATAERSRDGSPVHKRPGAGFRRGLEACADCLLLARCAEVIRTSSNLGLAATYFNPAMPVTLVSAV